MKTNFPTYSGVNILRQILIFNTFKGYIFCMANYVVKGGEYRMSANQKRKTVKVKRKLFLQCKCCRELTRTLLKGYCADCHEFNALMDAYGAELETKGLLPSLEDDDLKAYYPRT